MMGEQDLRTKATTREPVAFTKTDGPLILEMIQGPRPKQTFTINKRTMVIGKSRSADIQIIAHGLSRRHAKLVLVNDGPTVIVNLVDLGSTNGTFVNRSRIDLALLREGDLLQLGAHVTLGLSRRRPPVADDTAHTLTTRQLEVARLVANGARNAEIARFLDVTPRTVASHLERIYRVLEIGSRSELTRWLVEQDLHHDGN